VKVKDGVLVLVLVLVLGHVDVGEVSKQALDR
jgi:hypothetical protein